MGLAAFAGPASHCAAQSKPFVAQVQAVKQGTHDTAATENGPTNVVVWLTPLDGAAAAGATNLPVQKQQLIQRNKTFEPHVMVVQTGSQVQFPNVDPFFHNVFSLFDGKRFDLGLYESGTSKTVRFDHTGISFLFCNIHSEMSAVVIAVDTPYFGLSDRSGRITIANVPDGRYRMQVWSERSSPEALKALDQTVILSGPSRPVTTLQVVDNARYKLDHKNMYGQDYVPPSSAY